jgi:hypothetical protein
MNAIKFSNIIVTLLNKIMNCFNLKQEDSFVHTQVNALYRLVEIRALGRDISMIAFI